MEPNEQMGPLLNINSVVPLGKDDLIGIVLGILDSQELPPQPHLFPILQAAQIYVLEEASGILERHPEGSVLLVIKLFALFLIDSQDIFDLVGPEVTSFAPWASPIHPSPRIS